MRDEIIRMAKEAGFSEAWLTAGANPPHFDAPAVIVERFYSLAVQHEREAILAIESSQEFNRMYGEFSPKARDLAAAIRARGEKQ